MLMGCMQVWTFVESCQSFVIATAGFIVTIVLISYALGTPLLPYEVRSVQLHELHLP